jgi:hypothetical protein
MMMMIFASYLILVHWFLFCHFQVIPAKAPEEGTENYGGSAGASCCTHSCIKK